MDTSRVNQGELVAGASGLLLFLFLFLNWFGAFGTSASAWEAFDIVDIVLTLIGLGAVALAVLPMAGQEVNLPVARPRLLVILGIIATTITLNWIFEGDNLKFGIFLATLAAIGIIVGGYLAETTGPAGMGGGTRATAPPPAAPPPTQTAPPPGPGAGTPPAGPPGSEPPPRV
jgi:hypothetical protein